MLYIHYTIINYNSNNSVSSEIPCEFQILPSVLSPAEPARQAPNKRRKRKMSGGSTMSSGGGNNNNSNSKKKSPASSFALSSQVPVSISF